MLLQSKWFTDKTSATHTQLFHLPCPSFHFLLCLEYSPYLSVPWPTLTHPSKPHSASLLPGSHPEAPQLVTFCVLTYLWVSTYHCMGAPWRESPGFGQFCILSTQPRSRPRAGVCKGLWTAVNTPKLPWFCPNQSHGTDKMRQPHLTSASLSGEAGSWLLGLSGCDRYQCLLSLLPGPSCPPQGLHLGAAQVCTALWGLSAA